MANPQSMNDFIGVWGGDDPAGSVRRLGGEPIWSDAWVAFANAPVWHDTATGLVVSGEYVPTGQPRSFAEIATLFRKHGPSAGRLIDGMFALAFYDREVRQLTLLRDPMGARTLYYRKVANDHYNFATRLRPLKGSSTLSLPALRDYLTCAFVPGERTLWQDVYEMRPAGALSFPTGQNTTYWTPEEGPETSETPMEEYAIRLRPILEDAVWRRLPTSGPIGSYLSGGVDSSLVTALAAKERGVRRFIHSRYTSEKTCPMNLPSRRW